MWEAGKFGKRDTIRKGLGISLGMEGIGFGKFENWDLQYCAIFVYKHRKSVLGCQQ